MVKNLVKNYEKTRKKFGILKYDDFKNKIGPRKLQTNQKFSMTRLNSVIFLIFELISWEIENCRWAFRGKNMIKFESKNF